MENGISMFSSAELRGPWVPHGLVLNGTGRAQGGAANWDFDTTNPVRHRTRRF